ncbi:MAG: hypothetical protein ACTSUV_03815 [Candidatus Ranarchaeia archaeon]
MSIKEFLKEKKSDGVKENSLKTYRSALTHLQNKTEKELST